VYVNLSEFVQINLCVFVDKEHQPVNKILDQAKGLVFGLRKSVRERQLNAFIQRLYETIFGK